MAPLFAHRYQGPQTQPILPDECEIGTSSYSGPLSSALRRIYHGRDARTRNERRATDTTRSEREEVRTTSQSVVGRGSERGEVGSEHGEVAIASRCTAGRWRPRVFRRSHRTVRQDTHTKVASTRGLSANRMPTLREDHDETDFFSECIRAREVPAGKRERRSHKFEIPTIRKRRAHSDTAIDQALSELEEQCCRASQATASTADLPGSSPHFKADETEIDHEETVMYEVASQRSGVPSFATSILDCSYAPTDDGFDTWPCMISPRVVEHFETSDQQELPMWPSISQSVLHLRDLGDISGQGLQNTALNLERRSMEELIVAAEYELQAAFLKVTALKALKAHEEQEASYSAASSQASLGVINNADIQVSSCHVEKDLNNIDKANGRKKREHKSASSQSCPNSQKTTVMLRHVPADYTRDRLLKLLDSQGFSGAYNFLYLPVDFAKLQNCGYAFINWVSNQVACRACEHFDGFIAWNESVVSGEHGLSAVSKACEVSWSDPFQGLDANIERYRNSPVMHDDIPEQFKPVVFRHGVEEKFPSPTRKITRPRLKHGSPSKLAATMAAASARTEQKQLGLSNAVTPTL